MLDEFDTLKRGDSGEEVEALQAELRSLGFSIEPTGVYDDQTWMAVEEFQRAFGMEPDGIATKATRERITECVRCNTAGH